MINVLKINNDYSDRTVAIGFYYPKEVTAEDAFSKAIIEFKSSNPIYINSFAILCTKILNENNIKPDEIISVLGSDEIRTTSSQPLAILCQSVAQSIKCEFNKDAFSQLEIRKSLKDAGGFESRIEVLKNTLRCNGNFQNKKVLLVDDVITTGATLKYYTEMLKKNGADAVYFMSLGKTSHMVEDNSEIIHILNKLTIEPTENNTSENCGIELTEVLFPSKYIISSKIHIEIFKKYLSSDDMINNTLEKQIINRTLFLIPTIQYIVFNNVIKILCSAKRSISVFDSTFSINSLYFAIKDLILCYQYFINEEIEKKIIVYVFDPEGIKSKVYNLLNEVQTEILDQYGFETRCEFIFRFINDYSIIDDDIDLCVSEDNYVQSPFVKDQILIMSNQSSLSIQDIDNIADQQFEIEELTIKKNCSIFNIVSSKYLTKSNLQCFKISDKNTNVCTNTSEDVKLESEYSNICEGQSEKSNSEQASVDIKTSNDISRKGLEYFFFRLFGYSSLRDSQYEIIDRLIKQHDTLGILPTGGGKSVCFQFPAIISSGFSIVVTPLRSLMLDQVENLLNKGLSFVDYIDASKTSHEKQKIFEKIQSGEIKILYISPERLLMHNFKEDIKKLSIIRHIEYFIIDECHSMSEWGHDFRPCYLSLKDVSKELKFNCIAALTATASEKVQKDVLGLLNLKLDNVVKNNTLDRPELSFEVINVTRREDKIKHIFNCIENRLPEVLNKENSEQLHKDNSGLIFTVYANTKAKDIENRSTEYISKNLNTMFKNTNNKLLTKPYHSKLKDKERVEVQNDYKEDKFPILVATKGFGMGVDKGNIKYVIHVNAPFSLEAYYQEAGRSGRNKHRSHCIILNYKMDEGCRKILNQGKIEQIPCMKEKNLKCPNGGFLCDIATQLKLFLIAPDSNADAYIKKLRNFYYKLLKLLDFNKVAANKNDIVSDNVDSTETISTEKLYFKEEVKDILNEKMLCHLKKVGLIAKYEVEEYMDNFKVKFIIYGLKNVGQNDLNIRLLKIRAALAEYRKMKINMIKNMDMYMSDPKMCRRNFMLTYFDNTYVYNKPCHNCDIDVESQGRYKTDDVETMECKDLEWLKSCFEGNEFELLSVLESMKEAYRKNTLSEIRIKASRYLEDYPDNFNATVILKLSEILLIAKKDKYNDIDNFIAFLGNTHHKISKKMLIMDNYLLFKRIVLEYKSTNITKRLDKLSTFTEQLSDDILLSNCSDDIGRYISKSKFELNNIVSELVDLCSNSDNGRWVI